MKPKVSILLSLYKSEPYLKLWLKNIEASSSWQYSELIVVSNDPSQNEKELLTNFLSKWGQQTKVVYVNRENLYKSWNRAISLSEGEFLAIANVDDLRAHDGLCRQLEVLDRNPEKIFCHGSYVVVKDFGGIDGERVSVGDYQLEEYKRSMLLGPFFIWRRNCSLYFDEQFKSGGDFDFAIRLAFKGKGIYLDEVLGYYLNQGGGLSTGSILQPIERTVIELRYGIYDKIDYDYLDSALDYDVRNLFWMQNKYHISEIIPNYIENLKSNFQSLFLIGLIRYLFRKIKNRIKRLFLFQPRKLLFSVIHKWKK